MGEENTLAQEKCHQKQVSTFEKQTLRNHQDTIFSSLYSNPECVLDLYFTLHPEEKRRGITLNQVMLITLENVFLAQKHNDIAFQVGDRLIVLVEHQFTGSELFKKFLEKISAEEVAKMTNYEFDLEIAKEVWREEAMEEGWEEGMEQGMKQGIENGIRNIMDTMKLSLNQAMDALKIPAEEQPMYAARIRQQ